MKKEKEVSEFCLGKGMFSFGGYTFIRLLGTGEIFWVVILARVKTSEDRGSFFE